MRIQEVTKAHFIGVGGIGVSAILRLFAQRGVRISGSDVALPPLSTLPKGDYYDGQQESNMPEDVDIVIYSPAVPEANQERATAERLGITTLSYPEALALVTREYNTIAISGTHGKSTTTALMGKFFEAGELDPSVIVGAEVPGWSERNFRSGKSDIFIVEACEYRRNMLNLSPQTIVLTNIELDHPDYYHDLADVKRAFTEYVGKLAQENLLIVNNDDANVRDVARTFDGIMVRYGIGEGSDLYATNISESSDKQTFELVWKGTSIGIFTSVLPGLYNLYNILAASAAYLSYGGNTNAIQKVLNEFHGVGRRFDVVGNLGHTIVVSDYAHHPTALHAVSTAAARRYRDKRILTVFRPHHRERTIKLFDQFVETILSIPEMILVEIYDVAGREEATQISSKDIIAKVLEQKPDAAIEYAATMENAEQLIRSHVDNFDVVLVIGAGDADQLAKRLVQK